MAFREYLEWRYIIQIWSVQNSGHFASIHPKIITGLRHYHLEIVFKTTEPALTFFYSHIYILYVNSSFEKHHALCQLETRASWWYQPQSTCFKNQLAPSKNMFLLALREKRRDLTQSYDKSPYTSKMSKYQIFSDKNIESVLQFLMSYGCIKRGKKSTDLVFVTWFKVENFLTYAPWKS